MADTFFYYTGIINKEMLQDRVVVKEIYHDMVLSFSVETTLDAAVE